MTSGRSFINIYSSTSSKLPRESGRSFASGCDMQQTARLSYMIFEWAECPNAQAWLQSANLTRSFINRAAMLALIWTPGILVRIGDTVAFFPLTKKNDPF
jgi:hypothetical protein